MAWLKQSVCSLEEFSCPVCLETFKDPVIVACGHNFCKSCINKVWDSTKILSCPECREEFLERKYTVNRLLATLVGRVQKNNPGQREESRAPDQKGEAHVPVVDQDRGIQQCEEHEERLKLFCEEDGTLACVLCVPKHYGHHFISLQEAVNIYQDKLQTASESLESNLKKLQELQIKQEKEVYSINECVPNLQQHIMFEFEKLHQFLREKEEQMVLKLKEEAAGILSEMEENLSEIRESITTIEGEIFTVKWKMEQKDYLLFLTGIKDEMERLSTMQKQECAPEVSLVTRDLSLGVYKGPLQYSVWKEMRSIISPVHFPVTLDPITAHPELVLSEDLTSVLYANKKQQLPDNPERFDYYLFVLGSEGITAGRHCWEVDVETKTAWFLGVARESCTRKGKFGMNLDNGYWALWLTNRNITGILHKEFKQIGTVENIQKVLVYLDYEGGQLSYYNAEDMSHLYTFSDTFTERLYPFFSPCGNKNGDNTGPLKVISQKL
ncbi:zinc-binding protein A33-like [Protopterus annectens]|uniref:zinc-binding protein A33-like n=1 Tax=Protopterus annectens TaxID=7888 RepID=UPI001CF9E152|nr:zinc-binding protein A33-like [Protopterus annectens]